MSQVGLFGNALGKVGSLVTDEDRTLAAELPPWLRLGTSSWSFPGWAGVLYDRGASQQLLSREGLRPYAENPLFRTVGVDRSHYRPLTPSQWEAYAEQVPEDFRFLVKAHEHCTLHRFPSHPRYGNSQGQDNLRFLDPDYAIEAVVGPTVEGLKNKLGVLLFQFAQQDLKPLGGPLAFCDRLYAFLSRLPAGSVYAVEVRNKALLIPRFCEALEASGTMPCLASLPVMPELDHQWQQTPAPVAPVLVARWMLRPNHSYETASLAFHPYDSMREPDEATRETLVRLLRQIPGRPSYLIINNKAEGSSPSSVRALARAMTETP